MRFLEQVTLVSRPLFRFLGSSIQDDSCNLPRPYHDIFGTCKDENDCSGFVTTGLCHGADAIKCCTDTFAPDNGPSTGALSSSGVDFIHAFEGFVPFFYCDNVHPTAPPSAGPRGPCGPGEGILTIAWGHNCEVHDCSQIPTSITQAEGDAIFDDDVAGFVNHINAGLATTTVLTQNQFDALVSFTYNAGPRRFDRIVGFINSGDYDSAFAFMKSIGTGELAKQRRYMEINLFKS